MSRCLWRAASFYVRSLTILRSDFSHFRDEAQRSSASLQRSQLMSRAKAFKSYVPALCSHRLPILLAILSLQGKALRQLHFRFFQDSHVVKPKMKRAEPSSNPGWGRSGHPYTPAWRTPPRTPFSLGQKWLEIYSLYFSS